MYSPQSFNLLPGSLLSVLFAFRSLTGVDGNKASPRLPSDILVTKVLLWSQHMSHVAGAESSYVSIQFVPLT